MHLADKLKSIVHFSLHGTPIFILLQ